VLFLIAMVLIQRTDSDGLSGLGGGGGGGNQFMTGRAKGSLMTRTTAILAAAFMTTSLVLGIMAGHMTDSSIVDQISSEAPAASAEVAKEAPAKPAAPVVPKGE
jgi:preprotein translocase subunit SecG